MANNSHLIFYFPFHSFISLGAATLHIIVSTNQKSKIFRLAAAVITTKLGLILHMQCNHVMQLKTTIISFSHFSLLSFSF